MKPIIQDILLQCLFRHTHAIRCLQARKFAPLVGTELKLVLSTIQHQDYNSSSSELYRSVSSIRQQLSAILLRAGYIGRKDFRKAFTLFAIAAYSCTNFYQDMSDMSISSDDLCALTDAQANVLLAYLTLGELAACSDFCRIKVATSKTHLINSRAKLQAKSQFDLIIKLLTTVNSLGNEAFNSFHHPLKSEGVLTEV